MWYSFNGRGKIVKKKIERAENWDNLKRIKGLWIHRHKMAARITMYRS